VHFINFAGSLQVLASLATVTGEKNGFLQLLKFQPNIEEAFISTFQKQWTTDEQTWDEVWANASSLLGLVLLLFCRG
jgi:hypothetical protein